MHCVLSYACFVTAFAWDLGGRILFSAPRVGKLREKEMLHIVQVHTLASASNKNRKELLKIGAKEAARQASIRHGDDPRVEVRL